MIPKRRASRRAALLATSTVLVSFNLLACGELRMQSNPDVSAETLMAEISPSPAPSSTPIPATPITTFDGTHMIVGGEVWVNAEPAAAEVKAIIGGTECAAARALRIGDASEPRVTLAVPPSEEVAGCGAPGAVIHFEIDGAPAKQSVMWTAGWGVALTLTAGPEAAVYNGRFRSEDPPVGLGVEPFVNEKVCGKPWRGWQGEGPYWYYHVAVYPDEIVAGCGRPDATVTLRVVAVDDETGEATSVVGVLEGIEAEWAPGATTNLEDSEIVAVVGTAE